MNPEPPKASNDQTQNARLLKIINMARLRLAMWIWPKVVREGDCFTLTAILRLGNPTNDGSWVGYTLRADKVEGDRILFSEWYSHSRRFSPVNHMLIPGVNCRVKLVESPVKAPSVGSGSDLSNASGSTKQKGEVRATP
jgi:hypothetical protein